MCARVRVRVRSAARRCASDFRSSSTCASGSLLFGVNRRRNEDDSCGFLFGRKWRRLVQLLDTRWCSEVTWFHLLIGWRCLCEAAERSRKSRSRHTESRLAAERWGSFTDQVFSGGSRTIRSIATRRETRSEDLEWTSQHRRWLAAQIRSHHQGGNGAKTWRRFSHTSRLMRTEAARRSETQLQLHPSSPTFSPGVGESNCLDSQHAPGAC